LSLSRKSLLFLLLAITMLAAVVRLGLLGHNSLWLDEAVSLNLAQRDVAGILGNRADPHPPLYYLLLHFWSLLSTAEFWLRLPSALAALLSIPILYRLAKDWLGGGPALLAGLLLAVSPLHVHYSQEARMYSLVALLGLCSVLLLREALKGNHPLLWLGYSAATLAGMYTHYSMLVLLLAELAFLAFLFWARPGYRSCFLQGLAAATLVILGYLPWMPVLGSQAREALQLHMFQRARNLLSGLGWEMPAGLWVALGMAVLAAMGVLSWWLWYRGRRSSGPTLGHWAVLVVLYSFTLFSTLLPFGASLQRQSLVLLPYLLLAFAWAISRLRGARWAVAIVLVGLTLVPLGLELTAGPREDWRQAAALIEAQAQEGDVILLHAAYTRVPFDYYYRGDIPQIGVDRARLEEQLAQLSTRYRRAWVVLSHDSYVDPQRLARRWLAEHWDLRQKRGFKGIQVLLYETGRPVSLLSLPPPARDLHPWLRPSP
jgi:uncharacterized membrane protein